VAGGCASAPGAGTGASTKGVTGYLGDGTTVVRNVIFDASHDDDMVRVNNGKVIFENVTFRGRGTGDTGHSLEIKEGGSAEVRNSVFEGSPAEDYIQTQLNGPVLIECNVFRAQPGEDDIDTKSGGEVTVRNNTFEADPGSGETIVAQNGTSPVNFLNNVGVRHILYEAGQQGGVIDGNTMVDNGYVWLYDTYDILVQNNTLYNVKYGDSAGDREPSGVYFTGNTIHGFTFNGGSCHELDNAGAPLSQCSIGAPSGSN